MCLKMFEFYLKYLSNCSKKQSFYGNLKRLHQIWLRGMNIPRFFVYGLFQPLSKRDGVKINELVFS